MKNKIVAVLLVFLTATLAWGDSRTLRWDELSAFVLNRHVSLNLRDGSNVRGRAVAVRQTEFILEPGRRANRQSILRDQITSLEVDRSSTVWRVVGSVTGAAIVFTLCAIVAIRHPFSTTGGSDVALVVTLTGGGAVAGYMIGRAGDRRKTTVTLAKDGDPKP